MPIHLRNEETIVEAARSGNQEAFATLANLYEQNVYRLAVNITKNHEDAEDVRQEAMFKAYTNLERFRGGSRFYTWLTRIALNEALMKLRARRPSREVSLDELIETSDQAAVHWEIPDGRQDPEERCSSREVERRMHAAIASLDLPCRLVLFLRDIEDYSNQETADLLGVSMTTVKTRLRRARNDLKERLQEQKVLAN